MKDHEHEEETRSIEAGVLGDGAEARSEAPPPTGGLSGWRKAAVWLIGATLLAFVGYRSALGDRWAAAATPADNVPGAPAGASTSTGTFGERTAGEMDPRRGLSASAATARQEPPETSAAAADAAPGTDAVEGTKPGERRADPSGAGSATARTEGEPGSSQAITADGKIILNLATDTELRKLPGIGKARAKAILAERERLGKFRRIEELLRVKGIGRKRLLAIRNKIVLDPG